MKSTLRKLLWTVVLLVACFDSVSSGKGPPRINHEEASAMEIVRVGEPVRLVCPVTSDSHLFVQWSKDGEPVDETWPQFRISSRTLRVKTASVDMTGNYVCKGITGYGTAQHQMKLIVIDPANEPAHDNGGAANGGVSFGGAVGSGRYRHADGTYFSLLAAPKIVQTKPSGGADIIKLSAASTRLQCSATGHPAPQIIWYKDGTRLQSRSDDRLDLSVPGQLTIRRLVTPDSGTFECRATNVLDTDAAVFHLVVRETYHEKPEVLADSLRNLSVYEGDRVSLQCRVKGQSPVHVKWLKRLVDAGEQEAQSSRSFLDSSGREWSNTSVSDGVPIEMLRGNKYLVLNTSTPTPLSNDQVLSSLRIPAATSSDTGLYVCLAANSGGFDMRTAQVRVFSNSRVRAGIEPMSGVTGVRDGGQVIYVIIVAALLVALVVMVAGISCLCRHRRHHSSTNRKNHESHYKCSADPALMHPRNTFLSMPSEKERVNVQLVTEPSSGDLGTCSSRCCHDRRYDPLPPHPTPTPTEHTYNMLMPVGSGSSRSSQRDLSDSGGSWSYRAPRYIRRTPGGSPCWQTPQLPVYECCSPRHMHYAC